MTSLDSFSRQMLEISNSHIPERTDKLLDWQDPDINECPVPTLAGQEEPEALWNFISYVYWSDYGWVFHVSADQASAAVQANQPELAALLTFALHYGYDYLKLDRDAEILPKSFGLPEFSW